tara:strand:+ start:4166 stop:4510 length:345 start_codon:yes stop_codon:yes gene_type:complete
MGIVKTHFNMEEIEKESNEVTRIEISYESPEDLKKLYSSEEFISYIQIEVLDKIKYALKNNLKKVEVFNIINMAIILEIKKENFKDILKKINENYLKVEDFENCHEISKLINKL